MAQAVHQSDCSRHIARLQKTDQVPMAIAPLVSAPMAWN